MNRVIKAILFLVIALHITAVMASAQGTTAFNFQGQLKLNGKLANGIFDFEFTLFDGPDPLVDNPIGLDRKLLEPVSNGIFIVELDFGPDIFDGMPLWLQICVREAGETQLICLDPSQQIVPVPYATFAVNSSELDGHDSTAFLRRNAGCEICIGHADSNGSSPDREQCFDLSANGRNDSNFMQFSGNVDNNDRVWIWMQCP